MAGPSILVRVLGDLTGLGNSFNSAAQKGQAAAGGMHSAFSGMLGTLNSTGVLGPFGSALQTADMSLQNMGKHAQTTAGMMMGVGGALAGVGLALSAMGSKDQASHQQLQQAVKATGKSYDDYEGRIDAAVKHQEHFGRTANESQDALRILTQATHDPAKALDMLGTASELASAKHEDLSAAATSLGRVYNGSGRVLKEFGITMSSTSESSKALEKATKDAGHADDALSAAKLHLLDLQSKDAGSKHLSAAQADALKAAEDKVAFASAVAASKHSDLARAQDAAKGASKGHEDAIDALGKKLTGQDSAAANTFTGHLKALKAEAEDHIALFGQKYGGAITAAGIAMSGLGAAVGVLKDAQLASKVATVASTVAEGAQAAASGVATAATWLLNAALEANPLVLIATLIAVVIGAIVAIGIKFGWWKDIAHVLWAGIKDAFHGIHEAISAVWNWIKTNWPLLVGMLFGPFGIVVALIIEHWKQVSDFLKKIPGEILAAFKDAGKWLAHVGEDLWNGMVDGLTTAWHVVSDFFVQVPGWVVDFVKDAANWLVHIGADVIHGLWRGLVTTWHLIVEYVGGFELRILAAIGDAAQWLLQKGANVIHGMWAGIVNTWHLVTDFVGGMWAGVIHAIGDALSWLKGVGGDIVQGMLNGLQAAWHKVTDWFKSAMNLIPDAVKKVMGIFSPSAVMHTLGEQTMQGLGNGLQAGFDKHVQSALDRTVSALNPTGNVTIAGGSATQGASSTSLGRSGPAVHVEHATFNSGVDLDMFMGKAAWAVRTQRL
jgi:hypothetical protein